MGKNNKHLGLILVCMLLTTSVYGQDVVTRNRTCSVCKQSKPVSDFSGDSQKCKVCVRIAREQAEKKRIAREQAEKERLAREQAVKDSIEQEKKKYVYDGIEYKYKDPTQSQLLEWRKEYHTTCSRKIGSRLIIPKDMVKNHPCLVYLILISKSLKDDKEKQSWFDLFSLMKSEQIDKLYDILYRERYELIEKERKKMNKE